MAKRPVRMIFSHQRLRALVLTCLVMLAAWVLSNGLACSQTTRRHVLSFFFDGVPEVGQVSGARMDSRTSPTRTSGVPAVEPRPAALPMRYYAHTPYRENRCQGCHDPTSGQLIRSVSEGLCLTCHSKLTADARFVHGPVAVDDCTACHHFHGAPFPNQLLVDPVATCLNCHDREDLSGGDHHQSAPTPLSVGATRQADDQRSCVNCHNPHGGSDRFFLKRTEP
ncbi:MAG: cytochrome c3 family protein [Chloroflexota bacterium]